MAKKICIYGLLTALCMVLGYLEHFLSLSFISPGIKLGLANTVVLLLVYKKNITAAFAINITRILLSTLLFSVPSALIFSLSGGIISIAVTALFCQSKKLSIIGFSIIGAVVHNITQLICALFLVGIGVIYYLPLLLVAGFVSGIFIGTLANILFNKIKLNFR